MENSNIKRTLDWHFTSKGNKTRIDFTECVIVKNNYETLCKIIFKKTTITICYMDLKNESIYQNGVSIPHMPV